MTRRRIPPTTAENEFMRSQLIALMVNRQHDVITRDQLNDKSLIKPIVDDNIVETIMFASTCNTLILSKGTLSWLIGILSFYSTSIYYPQSPINFKSNIFVIPEWTEIDLKIE